MKDLEAEGRRNGISHFSVFSQLVFCFCSIVHSFVSGLSIGLNAINQIGNDMRDYRQETEIAQTRAQLQDARQREAEMEARLRQLEMANQNNMLNQQQQQQMMQLEMMLQQQKAVSAAATN